MARRNRRSKHPGVTVFKEGRVGTLVVKWIDPHTGKKRQRSLTKMGFDSKQEADDYLRTLSREIEDERRSVRIEGRKANACVEWPKIIESYLDHYGKVHSEQSKKRTDHALYALREWLAADGRNCRLGGDLTRLDLISLHDWLAQLRQRQSCSGFRGEYLQTDKPLSNASRNNYRSAIVALLNWARKRDYLRINGDDIRDNLPKFREKQRLPVEVTTEELADLITAVVKHDLDSFHSSRSDKHAYYTKEPSETAQTKYKPLAPLTFILMLTGMRLGEALHIRWENVDFDRKQIYVKADEGSNWDVKTKHERRVPFSDSPVLERLLTGLRLRRGENEYVVAGDDASSPRHFSRYSWDTIFGEGQRRVTPKMLRSTFATVLASARGGPTPYELAHRMGHSVEVAAKHYVAQSHPRVGLTVEEWMMVGAQLHEALGKLGFPVIEAVRSDQQVG